MGFLLWLLALAAGVYLALCALLFAQQRQLIYRPGTEAFDLASLAEQAPFQAIETRTADGLVLSHLWLPPAEDEAAPVLVVCHGNAGTAGGRAGKFLDVLPPGHGLLLVEYRGYGGNPGQPSETGLVDDTASTLRWLKARGIGPERWVFYGESLGSGVATRLAAELAEAGRPVAGVLLEAPFTSIAETAQYHYWYVPARWLVRDRFDNLARIGGLEAPLLILHGRRDSIVPYAMAERLAAAADTPKRLLAVDEGGHADLYDFPEVRSAITTFLAAR